MSKKPNQFSPEIRERAARMVREHRSEYRSLWAAIESIAPKIGCVPQTLNEWVKRDQVDTGVRDGITTSEREQMKALEREVKELRKANEILKLASAFFAQAELGRSRLIFQETVFFGVQRAVSGHIQPRSRPYGQFRAHSPLRTHVQKSLSHHP